MKEYTVSITFSGRKFEQDMVRSVFKNALGLNTEPNIESKPYKRMEMNLNFSEKKLLTKTRKLAETLGMDYKRVSTKNVVQQPENTSN